MLIPSRTKYRRVHRLPHEGRSRGNRELHFYDSLHETWRKSMD